jgi:TRAP-type C4-dicarboxylate transport system permease small subunit
MNKLISRLSKLESYLGMLLLVGLSLFVILDVSSREFLNQGIPWAQKSAVYMMIWCGLLGAIKMSENASHIRPEIGDKLFKKRPILFIRLQNLVTLLFCLIFFKASWEYVQTSYEYGDKSVALDIPLWVLQIIIPYCFLSMSVRHFNFLVFPNKQLEVKKDSF